jgi:ferredoxin
MISINPDTCPQNHRCPLLRICPVGAISQDGYGLPVIDEEKCIVCGKCTKYCPMKAVDMVTKKSA